jgi:hypothetical protein
MNSIPYVRVKVNDNGTVRLRRGIGTESKNIRILKPATYVTELKMQYTYHGPVSNQLINQL